MISSWGSRLVYVVGSEPPAQQSLGSILCSEGLRLRTFASGARLLRYAASGCIQPGCVLLDLHLPQMSGLEVQQQLQTMGLGDLPLIFLSRAGRVPEVVEVLREGAADVLEVPCNKTTLLETVQMALRQLDRRLRQARDMLQIRQQFEQLSRRERQVMALVCEGRLNKQVAAELQISPKTVEVHRGQVMKKMQVRSLPELVRLAVRLEQTTQAHMPVCPWSSTPAVVG